MTNQLNGFNAVPQKDSPGPHLQYLWLWPSLEIDSAGVTNLRISGWDHAGLRVGCLSNECVLIGEGRGGSDTDAQGQATWGMQQRVTGSHCLQELCKSLQLKQQSCFVNLYPHILVHLPESVCGYLTVFRAQIPLDVEFALHLSWQWQEGRGRAWKSPGPSVGASLLSFTPDTASRAAVACLAPKASWGTRGLYIFLCGQKRWSWAGGRQHVIPQILGSEASHMGIKPKWGHQTATCPDPYLEGAHLERRPSMALCGHLNSGEIQGIFLSPKRLLSSGWHFYHWLYFNTESRTPALFQEVCNGFIKVFQIPNI